MHRGLATAVLSIAALLAGCAQTAELPDPLDKAAYVIPDVPAVDAKALLADHLDFVTQNPERAANVPTHESARADLMARFEAYGLTAYRQDFHDGIPQANIMGIRWGVDRDSWVVVSAHYDTVTDDCVAQSAGDVPEDMQQCPLRSISQGAYDDGSGTIMMTHLAKVFGNATPYYTLAFVALDGEERGTQGAAAFVDAVLAGNLSVGGVTPTIVGNVDLDMIGLNWPGVNAPINVLTNSEALWGQASGIANVLGFPDGQIIRKGSLHLGSSDYARFWEVEAPRPIPTVFLISDFEELGAPAPAPDQAHTPTVPESVPLVSAGAYPFWHFQDTVETMTLMAGGQENLEAGFQSASQIAAHLVHVLAYRPALDIDAVAVVG